MMKFLEKKLINKYKGAAITAVSTAAVTFLVSKFGSAPESVQGVIKFILGAMSDGQITEITPVTMTTIITPIVAAIVAYAINWRQADAVEKSKPPMAKSSMDGLEIRLLNPQKSNGPPY